VRTRIALSEGDVILESVRGVGVAGEEAFGADKNDVGAGGEGLEPEIDGGER
jgi:hypothetical protein